MNILVVNYEYPPVGGGGGSCCKEIVELLAQRGHQVNVFTAGYKQFKKSESVHANLTIHKIKSNRKSMHEVGFMGLASFLVRGSLRIGRFIKKNKFDIIHYHFSVPTGLLTFFHTKKIPYIVTLHGIDVPAFHEDEFPAFQKLTKPFNKKIIKRATAVVAVSENLKQKAEESFPGKAIDVIYHGVDIKKFKRLSFEKKDNTIRFICVSRLVKFKRIDLLIKAFQICVEKNPEKQMELVIVGTGYLESELKALALETGVSDKIIFKGFIPNEEIFQILNEADIFVLPSVHDSFGIVFLEAMACGLPCIGARSAGVPEVIREGKTGLLAEPESVESLADCMWKLADNDKVRNAMGEESFQLIQNCYTWNNIVTQYENLFESVLKSKKAQPV